MKQCTVCKRNKKLDQFYEMRDGSFSCHCRDCHRKRMREKYHSDIYYKMEKRADARIRARLTRRTPK